MKISLFTVIRIEQISGPMVTEWSHNQHSDAVFVYYLSDTFALDSFSLHLGEVMVEGDNIGDDGFLIWELHIDICKENKIRS